MEWGMVFKAFIINHMHIHNNHFLQVYVKQWTFDSKACKSSAKQHKHIVIGTLSQSLHKHVPSLTHPWIPPCQHRGKYLTQSQQVWQVHNLIFFCKHNRKNMKLNVNKSDTMEGSYTYICLWTQWESTHLMWNKSDYVHTPEILFFCHPE